MLGVASSLSSSCDPGRAVNLSNYTVHASINNTKITIVTWDVSKLLSTIFVSSLSLQLEEADLPVSGPRAYINGRVDPQPG